MTPRLVAESARLAGQPLLRCQSDRRLVDLVRVGNDRAFEAIVDRYRTPLLRYCGRLLPAQRAEDAVQQTFLNAYSAMRRGDAELDLRPWLYRIARNACLNALRENGWSHEQIENLRRGTESAQEAFERRVELREIVAAVHTLPERQRDAVVLRELEGRSYDEIADALHTSDGAVRQLLNRARNALRAGVSAVTPTALLLKLATPRAHRVVAQVSEAAGQDGLRATAARVVGLVAASLLFFGGISQPPRVPAGAGKLSPGDSALTMLPAASTSAGGGASAPAGALPTGSGGTPFVSARPGAGYDAAIAESLEAGSGRARRIGSSRLPACRCASAPASSVVGGGEGSERLGLSGWASIVGAAVHVLGGHVTAPIAQAVERVVGTPVRGGGKADTRSAGPSAAADRAAVAPVVRDTATEAVTAIVTTTPVAQPREEPAAVGTDGGWDGASPEAVRDETGQRGADAEQRETQSAPDSAKPPPVDPDSVLAEAKDTTEIGKQEDGTREENEDQDPGSDDSRDRDDDEHDDVLPTDLEPDGSR